ncbi:MAG TPA: ribosome assembly cofactor RimP [Erysipelothrix sp.]|nr:ribosome assembly cofactor RimP [Erysipelothrix sp.]
MKSYLEIFEPLLDEMNLEITHANQVGGDLLELIISYNNSTESVDLDTCAKVAQTLAEAIDYEIGLDISSQGAEREIDKEDYDSMMDEYVYIKFINPKAGFDEIEGDVVEVNDDFIKVKYRFKHTHKTIEVERKNIALLRLAVRI